MKRHVFHTFDAYVAGDVWKAADGFGSRPRFYFCANAVTALASKARLPQPKETIDLILSDNPILPHRKVALVVPAARDDASDATVYDAHGNAMLIEDDEPETALYSMFGEDILALQPDDESGDPIPVHIYVEAIDGKEIKL